MKKILLSSLLLIAPLLSYSQDSLKISLVPKQVGKNWCFDSTQIRQLAVELNRSLRKDTLLILKDCLLDVQKIQIENHMEIADLERQKLVKEKQFSENLKEQLNWQYSREVKKTVGMGIIIAILGVLLIAK